MDNTKAVHWILGVALLMIGVFVVAALVMVNSQADDVTTSATIDNVAPSVDNVYLNDDGSASDTYTSGTVTLSAGTTKTFHIAGIVSDTNGDEDISKVAVEFYRTPVGSGCSADKNDCYKDDTDTNCSLNSAYGDSTQAFFDCTFSLEHYADATDSESDNYSGSSWTAWVRVIDNDTTTDTDSTTTTDIATLRSLSIPATISFGTMALGAATTSGEGAGSNVQMSIANYGNDNSDVEVSGANLSCTGSTEPIPMANVEWSLSDVGMDSGTDMTGSAVDTNFGIAAQTVDGPDTVKKLYWNIQIPTTGVEGTCSGTTTITSIDAE